MILKEYVKTVYKGFPSIMIHSDDGWICILHEHWKYLEPAAEAPKVYIGGKLNINTKSKYPYSLYIPDVWQE